MNNVMLTRTQNRMNEGEIYIHQFNFNQYNVIRYIVKIFYFHYTERISWGSIIHMMKYQVPLHRKNNVRTENVSYIGAVF